MSASQGQNKSDEGVRHDRIAHRVASTDSAVPPQVDRPNPDLASPTISAVGTFPTPRRRVSTKQLIHVAESLSDQQWEILRTVAEHRFLKADQLMRLHFAHLSPVSRSRLTQKALQDLRRNRLLNVLDRRIGGVASGSSGLVYYLDVAGYRLLHADTSIRAIRHTGEPSIAFLDHTLEVAETYTNLVEADRRGACELVGYAIERRFQATTPLGKIVTIKPDLYVETSPVRGSETIESFFLEVDRGTESIPRMLTKCHVYQAYDRLVYGRGRAPRQVDGDESPPTVWIMTHRNLATAERRRLALKEAIADDTTLDDSLFHVISPDQLIYLITEGGDV